MNLKGKTHTEEKDSNYRILVWFLMEKEGLWFVCVCVKMGGLW